jgi:prevent-host-death family protein
MQHTNMTATVEQTQRELARLIRRAVEGEEIVITEGGQPVAKLTGIRPANTAPDRGEWLKSLRLLRDSTSTGKMGRSADEILAEDRADRD